MKKSKIIHFIILALFVYCAYVQLNDQDAWIWIILYLSVAILPLLSLLNYPTRIYARILSLALGIILLLNYNLLSSWLDAGRPAFIDYEPTYIREVENIREFIGLVICFFAAMTYIFIFNRNKIGKAPSN